VVVGGAPYVDAVTTALFPHHHWADADGLLEPDPALARKGYFHHDPDAHSSDLRASHLLLWNRRLPDGTGLELQVQGSGLLDIPRALYLSSDAAVPVWERWGEVQSFHALTEQLLQEVRVGTIHDLGWRLYDMGGFILFPGFQTARGLWTINQAKGCTRQRIADRLDLTLECIRLYYREIAPNSAAGDPVPDGYDRVNPLGTVLHRYQDYFTIFGSFDNYVTFWLLEDLVTDTADGPQVRFMLRGRGASGPYDFEHERALPVDAEGYLAYLLAADDFVEQRNRRMAALAAQHSRGEVCSTCLGESGPSHHRWTL
jgi:hypothetical protein